MHQPFRGSTARLDGRLSRAQLRGAARRRVFRDVYLDADVELTHELRCTAAMLILPATAALSGRSAACLHGAGSLAADGPVEVTSDRKVRPRAGILIRRSSLAADDVVTVRGLRVTTLVRTAFDLARAGDVDEAIIGLDALLTLGGLSWEEIAAYAARRHAWPGTRQVPGVLAAALPGAESPMETRLRMALVRAGLRTPAVQHRVRDERGVVVARLDLAYVAERLGIEYDGGCHFEPRAVRKDLRRQNALRALGWSLFRFTAADVLDRPDRLVAEVRAALAS